MNGDSYDPIVVSSLATNEQQQRAARALSEVLQQGVTYGLPCLEWAVTHGGVLVGRDPRKEPRLSLYAWTSHLRMPPVVETLCPGGGSILRSCADSGVPGGTEGVRIVVMAWGVRSPGLR